jgi:hypothetical protein
VADVITIDVNPESNKDKFNTRWWHEKDEDIYSHLFRTVQMLETRQSYRTAENIKHARLYSDLEILGIYAGLYSATTRDSLQPNRLSLNVVKSCVDTVTSKIAKSKPRPMFLTEGGDWDLRQRAKQYTKYMDGQFDAMNHYEHKQDSFRDACIFGTGAVKFYIDDIYKVVKSERVVIEELMVDDAEAIYGKPRTMYQKRLVNKDVLSEYCPKHRDKIQVASNMMTDNTTYSSSLKDLVKVVEGWHLPSSPDAKDGKHVICVNNATIFTEAWEFDWFPFSIERWNKSIVGFFGVGIARELTGIQIEINSILRNIQKSMHLFAVPRVFVDNASGVNLSAINNDIGAIIKHNSSQAPTFYVPQAMSADVYNHLWNLVGKAYEITGISQLSATSQKPSGLDSAVAMREYQDIESDRFQIVGQRREQSFLEDSKITVALQKKLSKKYPDAKVKVADKGKMSVIKFKDIDMDDDKYLMRVFPSSILPTQPAAKMQTVVEWAQAGWIDKETAQDLMDFPDLEAATNLQVSPRRVVLMQLDAMIDSGEYQPPEPFMNLQLAKGLSQQYYLAAKNQGVPEERLELLRRYMEQIVTLEQQAQQALMPPPMAEMAPEQGVPGLEQALPAEATQAPINELLPQSV